MIDEMQNIRKFENFIKIRGLIEKLWMPSEGGGQLLASIVLTVILLIGMALRFYLITGPVGSDDTRYFEFSQLFVELKAFSTIDHAAGRLLFLVLMGIPGKLGGSIFFCIYFNILLSLITNIIVVLFCLKKFGQRASILAAVLMSFCPISVLYSGMLLPDTSLTLFMLVSVLILYTSIRSNQDSKKKILGILLAGVFAGFAYQCKDPGILLLPPVAAFLFLFPNKKTVRNRLIEPALFVSGFALVFIADGLVYFLYTGDYFYKFTATGLRHNAYIAPLGFVEFLQKTTDTFIESFDDSPFVLIPVVLGLPALLIAAIVSQKTRLFAFVGLFVLLFLFFGSSSLTHLKPLPYQIRYLDPVVPFAVIAICGLFNNLQFTRRFLFRFAIPVVAFWLILLNGGYEKAASFSGRMYNAHFQKSFRNAVEIVYNEFKDIYVDEGIKYYSRFFLSPRHYRSLKSIPKHGQLPDGYYIIQNRMSKKTQRLTEIEKLPVKFVVALDWSSINQSRRNKRYYGSQPVYVHEHRSTGGWSGRPDLLIYTIRCKKEKNDISVCTIGMQNRSPFWSDRFILVINNNSNGSSKESEVSSLRGYEFVTKVLSIPLDGGKSDLQVCVDAREAVSEENEANNCIVISQ
jgi:hypothetical protein